MWYVYVCHRCIFLLKEFGTIVGLYDVFPVGYHPQNSRPPVSYPCNSHSLISHPPNAHPQDHNTYPSHHVHRSKHLFELTKQLMRQELGFLMNRIPSPISTTEERVLVVDSVENLLTWIYDDRDNHRS